MASNNAIICLTRGYHNLKGYDSLIKRNQCIYKFLTEKLVIFHEGNITKEHQDYIRTNSPNEVIEFVDISPVWVGGYESMCRFQAYWVWEYCKEYDNVLRVDEDCHITSIEPNLFDMGDMVYKVSTYWEESHTETNATLPAKVEYLTGVSKDEFYNQKFPYTNVSVSNVEFWRTGFVAHTLKQIALCPEQLENRWGDLPVLGCLLNIFAKGKVGVICNLEYNHLSHNNVIKS